MRLVGSRWFGFTGFDRKGLLTGLLGLASFEEVCCAFKVLLGSAGSVFASLSRFLGGSLWLYCGLRVLGVLSAARGFVG